MEEIKVYNTLTGEKTVFRPLVPGEVKIYVCGVTPYNHPHIGNARPAVTWDVICRYLKHIGYIAQCEWLHIFIPIYKEVFLLLNNCFCNVIYGAFSLLNILD